MKRVWTEEKDELLARLYPTAHLGNLAFRLRVTKAQATRNKSIRRDKIRLHYGMEPIGNLVKRW